MTNKVLICFLINIFFCLCQIDICLKDEACKSELQRNYGQRLTLKVAAFKKGLLKKLDSNPNLIIIQESNNFYFIATAVDILSQFILTECKSSIKLYNEFPFFYEFSGATEMEGKYNNMNCFFVDSNQYNILQKCIPPDTFNIYDKRREEVVTWTEQECESSWFFFETCDDVQKSRTDVYIDKVICIKQQNEVYDAFVEIAKMDLMKENGGKDVQNLLQELPSIGTTLNNSCMPNCENCLSFDKCNRCELQYSLIHDECLKCHSTCLTCSDPDYKIGCLTCQQGLGLYYGQCLEKCPDGFMNLNGNCQSCEAGCKQCNGQSSNCIECYDGLFLQHGICQSKCDNGFYLDSISERCISCRFGCKTCLSEQYCFTCETFYLKQGNQCVLECSKKQMNISGVCTDCNLKCGGCEGNVDNCTNCSQGYFMQDGVCVGKSQCKEGYYGDEDKRSCEKCHENCKLCRGPSYNDCISCAENSCISQVFNTQKQLIEMNCILSKNAFCELCDEFGMCMKCKQPKLLINNLKEGGTCDDICPSNYYKEGDKCQLIFVKEESMEGNKNKLSALEIILIILAIGLFIFISFALLCKFYYNRKIIMTPTPQLPETEKPEGIPIQQTNVGNILTSNPYHVYYTDLKESLKTSIGVNDVHIEGLQNSNPFHIKNSKYSQKTIQGYNEINIVEQLNQNQLYIANSVDKKSQT